MSSILEVSEVRQSFRVGFWMKNVEILHGINLSIPRRSIFGFLGANGAGKTTLIHLVVGLRKPTAGSVKVDGHDALSPSARAKIGYLPERPYFHEHLTGDGLLKYFGALAGMKRNEILSRIPLVLKSVGMSHARNTELRRYSKGMLQRIGIAQALLHDPEFLVLDEPMSGLDPLGRKEMRELIVELASEGRTIFFSTHVIPDVEAICNQVAIIQKGNLIGCGPIGKFLSQGPAQTEIIFTGMEIQAAKKVTEFLSIRETPDSLHGVIANQDSINPALEKLLKAGAKIFSINPVRPSLEAMFEKGTIEWQQK